MPHDSSIRPKRSRHHLKVLAAAAAAAALNAGEQASAAMVGIHFQYIYNGGTGATINTASSVVFAGVPSALWNNMAPVDIFGNTPLSQTGQALTTPGATGITLDYSAQNAWAPYGAVTDQNAAYFSYLDDTVGANYSGYKVTIHGLSSLLGAGEAYSLTALQATDTTNATFGSVFIYAGTDTTGTLLATLTDAAPFQFPGGAGTYGDTNASPALTTDTITIVGAPRNGDQRSTLAGLAITTAAPEPGSVVLVLAGMTFLVRRRGARNHHA